MEYTAFFFFSFLEKWFYQGVMNNRIEQHLIDILPPKDPITIKCEQITTKLSIAF